MSQFHISRQKRLKFLSSLSDEELALRYRKRPKDEIITELFNRYIHLVYAVCMKYMKNEEKARDKAMEVFEALGSKLIRFEVTHFNSWLLTLTKNECLMQLRKKKREYSVENDEIIRLGGMENKDELHLNEGESVEELVINSLKKLRDCQRQCLDLMYLQNKSYKEIALITGYSLQEVKSYIQNGRRNLKNLMTKDYGKEG